MLGNAVRLGAGFTNAQIAVRNGKVYWTHNDDLRQGSVSGTGVSNESTANAGGWSTVRAMAVEGTQLFFANGGNLYYTSLSVSPLSSNLVDPGGWNRPFTVIAGYAYFFGASQLFRVQLAAAHPTSEVVRTVSVGNVSAIASDANSIYFTKHDDLYVLPLIGNSQPQVINPGGWGDAIAVDDGYIYWVSGDHLYRAALT